MKKINTIILCCVLLLFAILIIIGFYTNIWLPTSKDYDRTIYSVVIYNNTDKVINNVTISYGSENKSDSLYEFSRILYLQPKEYRKINIPTKEPSSKAKVPYNVWINFDNELNSKGIVAGYFGKNTGGLAYVKIISENNKLLFYRVFEHEREYKQIERRHRRKQTELSWY